eukprot:scaffold51525_cov63-Phaeocystis_antarctica.AAC.9
MCRARSGRPVARVRAECAASPPLAAAPTADLALPRRGAQRRGARGDGRVPLLPRRRQLHQAPRPRHAGARLARDGRARAHLAQREVALAPAAARVGRRHRALAAPGRGGDGGHAHELRSVHGMGTAWARHGHYTCTTLALHLHYACTTLTGGIYLLLTTYYLLGWYLQELLRRRERACAARRVRRAAGLHRGRGRGPRGLGAVGEGRAARLQAAGGARGALLVQDRRRRHALALHRGGPPGARAAQHQQREEHPPVPRAPLRLARGAGSGAARPRPVHDGPARVRL